MSVLYENTRNPITVRRWKNLTDRPHLHNSLELVYLYDGQSGTVCDDHRGILSRGDVFLAFPNQVHSYPWIGDGKAECFVMIFKPGVCDDFAELFHQMTPISPIVHTQDLDPDIPGLIEKINQEQRSDNPYREAITRGYIITLLGKLFRSMEFREKKTSDEMLLKSILNYCNKNYTEPLSLEILAKELNAGKYYISHIFSDKLQISFPDYINRLRINDAICLLTAEPDRPITDVAYSCGFSSIRTFNRAFIKYTGMTPRDYRKENRYKDVTPINFYSLNEK